VKANAPYVTKWRGVIKIKWRRKNSHHKGVWGISIPHTGGESVSPRKKAKMTFSGNGEGVRELPFLKEEGNKKRVTSERSGRGGGGIKSTRQREEERPGGELDLEGRAFKRLKKREGGGEEDVEIPLSRGPNCVKSSKGPKMDQRSATCEGFVRNGVDT